MVKFFSSWQLCVNVCIQADVVGAHVLQTRSRMCFTSYAGLNMTKMIDIL